MTAMAHVDDVTVVRWSPGLGRARHRRRAGARAAVLAVYVPVPYLCGTGPAFSSDIFSQGSIDIPISPRPALGAGLATYRHIVASRYSGFQATVTTAKKLAK